MDTWHCINILWLKSFQLLNISNKAECLIYKDEWVYM